MSWLCRRGGWGAMLVVVAAVLFAPAAAAGRSCGTARVSPRSVVTIVPAGPGAVELGRRPRPDTAYFVRATGGSCAGAWRLLQTVVPAGDERAAIAARGYRVVGLVRGLRLSSRGPSFHRVISRRGATKVSYVRLGRGWVTGHGLGGGLEGRARLGCRQPYHLLGLRGSGEGLDGPFRMASTVGGLAGPIVSLLGRRAVRTVSIPYPAAGTGVLARGDIGAFLGSMYRGQELLADEIRRISARCPRARIGVIAYSQGAAAASEAIRSLPERTRNHVRVAVLIADPYSRRGGGDDLVIDPLRPGEQAVRAGEGILGGRRVALGPGRLYDVCLVNDYVCDSRQGVLNKLFRALVTPAHGAYKSCCFGVPLLGVLGRIAARRLRG